MQKNKSVQKRNETPHNWVTQKQFKHGNDPISVWIRAQKDAYIESVRGTVLNAEKMEVDGRLQVCRILVQKYYQNKHPNYISETIFQINCERMLDKLFARHNYDVEHIIDKMRETLASGEEIEKKESNNTNVVTFLEKIDDKGNFTLIESFFITAENQGLGLLLDDKKWLRKICAKGEKATLREVLKQYAELWLSSMNEEPLTHKKQNVGRFAANTFLREFMEKNHKENHETKTNQPPNFMESTQQEVQG